MHRDYLPDRNQSVHHTHTNTAIHIRDCRLRYCKTDTASLHAKGSRGWWRTELGMVAVCLNEMTRGPPFIRASRKCNFSLRDSYRDWEPQSSRGRTSPQRSRSPSSLSSTGRRPCSLVYEIYLRFVHERAHPSDKKTSRKKRGLKKNIDGPFHFPPCFRVFY